jgi:predicted small secreted protein
MTRKVPAALLAALALLTAGCKTDEAVEKDVKNGAQDVKKAGHEAGKDAEKALPGDADDDGK